MATGRTVSKENEGDSCAYSVAIRDLPEEERPRERLMRYGARNLSTQELLAIVLRSGTPRRSALSLADQLLHRHGGLRGLAAADIAELTRTAGVGPVKAIQIAACIELGKRMASHQEDARPQLTSPEAVVDVVECDMRDLKVEEFRALLLDTKNRLIRVKTISIGTLDASLVHPREVFREAVAAVAAGVIVVHNHPSGDPTPSREDEAVTRRLVEAAQIIGIDLIDHVIIGDGRWVSLKQSGRI